MTTKGSFIGGVGMACRLTEYTKQEFPSLILQLLEAVERSSGLCTVYMTVGSSSVALSIIAQFLPRFALLVRDITPKAIFLFNSSSQVGHPSMS